MATFDKLLGKVLLHNHKKSDIKDFWSNKPTSPTSTGTKGSIAFDTSHLYLAVANNTWRRVQLNTWVPGESYLLLEDDNYLLAEDGTSIFLLEA